MGALGGLVAGIVAANNSSADHQPSADDWRQKEQEHTAERGTYGLVLTPPEVPAPLVTGDSDPNKNETALSVLPWNGTPAEKLVDRSTQLWWPNDDPQQPGYSGRRGVRVQNDSMLRRSGIPFPEFRSDFIRELLEAAVSS